MNQPQYTKARLGILNYIIAFCTHDAYGGRPFQPLNADHCFASSEVPILNTLVKLQSAPFTKWYLSWLIEYKPDDGIGGNYLLRSIEDGSLCWWTNVSVKYYPIDKIWDQWRWDDTQHEFQDKLDNAFKQEHAYITLNKLAKFDGNSVTVSTRERHGFPEYSYSKTFDDFRKVRLKDLRAFYKEAIANKPVKT